MNLLENINKPEDLKKLDISDLTELASETRKFLIKNISKTGGHLSSNLGVVELTIALLYCLDQPKDKIIWDVGHQSYVHKILTGRRDKFNTLRQYKGLSGFPKPSESKYDSFVVGHSSTSISVGLGFSLARDLNNSSEVIVSVIGDGALTGGMAYEALNHAGRLNSNLIVILNDNQMSIGENTSAISKSLNNVRTTKSYLNAKKDITKVLQKMSVIGDKTKYLLDNTKDKLKNLLLDITFFEELGFRYYGKIDGHDINELIKYINVAKEVGGPVLLHVSTVKGKGYDLAEENPTSFHGVSKFDIKSGEFFKSNAKTYTNVFSETILDLGKINEKVIAITASMPDGTGLNEFKKQFPNRFFDVGIAEEHAVTFASGLSKNGFIPFFAVYSTFLQRAYDQIIHDVAIQNLHVVFCIDRAGVVGEDGETHQGVFDISYLNHIPNMTVLAPANYSELSAMMYFALKNKGPISIRYPKSNKINTLLDFNKKIELGKSNKIFENINAKIAIISVGSMLSLCNDVYEKLKEDKIDITLINLRFIKPIDVEMIKSLNKYKDIIVVEDNINLGGVSNIILKYLNDFDINVKVHSFSYDDKFLEHGTIEEIQNQMGISVLEVYNKILNLII